MAFVSLAEGIDADNASWTLQLHVLGAIAEFVRRGLPNGSGLVWLELRAKASDWGDL